MVIVGRVLRSSGSAGDLRIEELTDSPRRFAPKSRLFIGDAPYIVEGSQSTRGSTRIIKLKGIDTLAAAEELLGAEIHVPVSELAPLPEGTYYHYHLIGLTVVTSEGETLGELIEILETGANDVFVVSGEAKERLLPAVGDVIKAVDLDKGTMVIEVLPGLL